jgi:acyl transferase domain-containing protein
VVFAGGIHDHVSAAMVAALAAPLTERGIHVGVLMGTAYLFTQEAVNAGAIVNKFQEEALKCEKTTLLETGPGHAIRCIKSPYKTTFDDQRKSLEAQNKGREVIREQLELMNLGRLRIASKGLARVESAIEKATLSNVSEEKQWADGMYMIGQVAAMHDKVLSIKSLHKEVADGSAEFITKFLEKKERNVEVSHSQKHEDVAIVGMSCLFPKASDLEAFWANVLSKVDAISEVPKDQWNWEQFFDANRLAPDKIYSKWGGFLSDFVFDPTAYGIPPSSLASIDPMQIIMLEVTKAALKDAGLSERDFARERTSVVLANAGHAPITGLYALRTALSAQLRNLDPEFKKQLEKELPEWTEDTFPGFLGNVTAGRVANRFDFGGINFAIDAACASSLAALYVGIRDLRAHNSDIVLVQAIDTHNQPGDYLSFSKVHALSPRGRCRTFDASADGIAISEGAATIVLKRLSDAERDGDRIYAVIKGIGGSSDGRDLSLTAPRPQGQITALNRAYEDAQLSPNSIELVEAHGTGTTVGDKAEIESLRQVFVKAEAASQSCAVGSVKSMIGHTKCAAGLASIIKVAKALHHKVLPATMGVENPNPACDFRNGPFYINSESRPWIHTAQNYPRRAGVSAFGFGGTNFHTILEEYETPAITRHDPLLTKFPCELFLFQGQSREELFKSLKPVEDALSQINKIPASTTLSKELIDQFNGKPTLGHLSYATYLRWQEQVQEVSKSSASKPGDVIDNLRDSLTKSDRLTLAIVASSFEELQERVARAKQSLSDPTCSEIKDPRGIYFSDKPLSQKSKIAFLFPGQGSQRTNMLKDLGLYFKEIRETFEQADKVLATNLPKALTSYVFPPPPFNKEEQDKQEEALTNTHIAQPAMAAADMAMLTLLSQFGLRPDMVAGHSFGEYVALWAAGSLNGEDLLAIAEERGRLLATPSSKVKGAMAAVSAPLETVKALLNKTPNVTLANINAPNQCILSGDIDSIEQAIKTLSNEVNIRRIPVSAAFHSPHMQYAKEPLYISIARKQLHSPKLPVYSNIDAKPHPKDANEITTRLAQHLVSPVEFVKEIEAMYNDGARLFVEIGPGSVMTNLVDAILENKIHQAVSTDRTGRNGLLQLLHALAQMASQGVAIDISPLFEPRAAVNAFNKPESLAKAKKKLLYLVNGARFTRLIAGDNGSLEVQPPKVDAKPSAKTTTSVSPPANTTTPSNITQSTPPQQSSPTKSPAPTVANMNTNQPIKVNTNGNGHGNGNGNGNGHNGSKPVIQTQIPTTPMPLGVSTSDQVMMQFQQTMLTMTQNFLETQQNVMIAYLQSRSGQVPSLPMPAIQQMPMPVMQQMPVQMPQAQFIEMPAMPAQTQVQPQMAVNVPAVTPVSEVVQQVHQPTPATTAAAAPTTELSADELVSSFLEIVSERTGYPPEMLDLNLDMEADLGIDSIKRVEILSTFRKVLPETKQQEIEGHVEKLAGTKTLQAIIDWIREYACASPSPQASTPPPPTPSPEAKPAEPATPSEPEIQSTVRRGLVVEKKLQPATSKPIEIEGVVVVVSEKSEVAEDLLNKLVTLGQSTVIVSPAASVKSAGNRHYEADLSDADSIKQVLALINKQYGKTAGLVNLLSLNTDSDDKLAVLDVRAFFQLLKQTEKDLRSERKGKAIVSAVTTLGGDFASCGKPLKEGFKPLSAGVVGMCKTISREWPEVKARAIDFAPEISATKMAELILAELQADDEPVEIGYHNGERITLDVQAAPLASNQQPMSLDSSSIVLITGGARGITAEIAVEMAEKYKPTIILVGKMPRPDGQEAADTAKLSTPRELKAAIMESLRQSGQTVSISQVEQIYQKLLREREVRNNITRIEQAGSKVRYYAIDVKDQEAFAQFIDSIYEMFGKIDAVINGAGVIEDAFIADKSFESFNLVFDTKIKSAMTLARKLNFETLKYLIFFSSVVGRTGNAGQVDYVAANEAINKLAVSLSRKTNARVASIMWGPWRGGMARPEMENIFAKYGWAMIPPEKGRKSFAEEIAFAGKENVEVLLVGKTVTADTPNPEHNNGNNGHNGNGHDGNGKSDPSAIVQASGARLFQANLFQPKPGTREFDLVLDPANDLYLKDHQFDGIPVLPMVMALEMMLEAATQTYSKLNLDSIIDLEIPSGIVFESGPKKFYVTTEEQSSSSNEALVKAQVATGEKLRRTNFRLQAKLSNGSNMESVLNTLQQKLASRIVEPQTTMPTAKEIYDNWMFHGPIFQGIQSIEALARTGITGYVKGATPGECLKSVNGDNWIIDPVMLDSAMQLAGVWTRKYLDMMVLPTGFKKLHLLSPLTGKTFKVQVFIPEDLNSNILNCDLAIWSEDGTPAIYIEGLGGIGSRSFNRLSKAQAGSTK